MGFLRRQPTRSSFDRACEEYRDRHRRLVELEEEVAELRGRIEQHPDERRADLLLGEVERDTAGLVEAIRSTPVYEIMTRTPEEWREETERAALEIDERVEQRIVTWTQGPRDRVTRYELRDRNDLHQQREELIGRLRDTGLLDPARDAEVIADYPRSYSRAQDFGPGEREEAEAELKVRQEAVRLVRVGLRDAVERRARTIRLALEDDEGLLRTMTAKLGEAVGLLERQHESLVEALSMLEREREYERENEELAAVYTDRRELLAQVHLEPELLD